MKWTKNLIDIIKENKQLKKILEDNIISINNNLYKKDYTFYENFKNLIYLEIENILKTKRWRKILKEIKLNVFIYLIWCFIWKKLNLNLKSVYFKLYLLQILEDLKENLYYYNNKNAKL